MGGSGQPSATGPSLARAPALLASGRCHSVDAGGQGAWCRGTLDAGRGGQPTGCGAGHRRRSRVGLCRVCCGLGRYPLFVVGHTPTLRRGVCPRARRGPAADSSRYLLARAEPLAGFPPDQAFGRTVTGHGPRCARRRLSAAYSDVQPRADGAGVGASGGGVGRALQLAFRRCGCAGGSGVCDRHLHDGQLASGAPPRHEYRRCRGCGAVGRCPAEL